MATTEPDILGELDEKEKLIFELLAQGLRTSEISKMLSLSYHDTAEISKLLKMKLNVSSVLEMKNIAVLAGLQKKNYE